MPAPATAFPPHLPPPTPPESSSSPAAASERASSVAAEAGELARRPWSRPTLSARPSASSVSPFVRSDERHLHARGPRPAPPAPHGACSPRSEVVAELCQCGVWQWPPVSCGACRRLFLQLPFPPISSSDFPSPYRSLVSRLSLSCALAWCPKPLQIRCYYLGDKLFLYLIVSRLHVNSSLICTSCCNH